MMRAGGTARCAWWVLAAALLALMGCKEAPTQIVVSITSPDLLGGRDLQRVTVTAAWRGEDAGLVGPVRPFDLVDGGYSLPGRVVVTPPDPSEGRTVVLTVSADVGEGASRYTVTQTFATQFARGRTKEVFFSISRQCNERQVRCPADFTCVPTDAGARCVEQSRPVEADYAAGRRSDAQPNWGDTRPAEENAGVDADVTDVVAMDVDVSDAEVVEEVVAVDVDVPDADVVAMDVDVPDVDRDTAADTGSAPDVITPTCTGDGCAEQIAIGGAVTCTRTRGGDILCWGAGADLGVSSGTPRRPSGFTSSPSATRIAIGPGTGGGQTACFLRAGNAWCWGTNGAGQVGDGTTTARLDFVQVGGLPTATDVSVGRNHACAVLDDGRVMCWGGNDTGQLGVDMSTASMSPTPREVTLPDGTTPLRGVARVAAGNGFTCALQGTRVICWGSNGLGALGDTGATRAHPASPISGLEDVLDISAGYNTVCARRVGGRVSCWGQNSSGMLGVGDAMNRSTPVEVRRAGAALANVIQIVAGDADTCAVREDGETLCWGDNSYGQVGDGTTGDPHMSPGASREGTSALQVAVGPTHACGLNRDGSVECWGDNAANRLGNNSPRRSTTPVRVVGYCGAGFASVLGACVDLTNDPDNCGSISNRCTSGSCVGGTCQPCPLAMSICGAGLANCKNLSFDAENCGTCSNRCPAGQGCVRGSCTPRQADSLVAAGNATCLLYNDGRVVCWGTHGTIPTTATPAEPSVLRLPLGVLQLAIAGDLACARLATGRVVCWGSVRQRDGTAVTLAPESAREVRGLRDVEEIAAGSQGSRICARRRGQVWCWGDAPIPGDDVDEASYAPVRVTGVDGATSIAVGQHFGCALLGGASSSVSCWGRYPSLFMGAPHGRATPIMAGLPPLGRLIAGPGDVCGIAPGSEGSAYCWGRNTNGILGNGSAAEVVLTPALVMAPMAIRALAIGTDHACGVLSDSSVSCWGHRSVGQLGDGTGAAAAVLTPAPASRLSGAALFVAAGVEHTCVVMSDQTVRCFGGNSAYQLGNGTMSGSTASNAPGAVRGFPWVFP